jgi:hypothetical protein
LDLRTILYWLLPALVMLAVHWHGLFAWFQQDDFAWLGLLREVREGVSLVETLFHPSQHGTWRPLSERTYFLLLPALFGVEAWPMRVAAFATQAGSLALVQAIVLHLTGSRLAAVLAPVLWIVNSKLTIAMISNGAYVHVLGGFLLLLATWYLLTERWGGMWAAFLTGFLASESNVVFPAVATAYCVLLARGHLRRVLWLWPVAVGYFLLHMRLAPKMAAGSYAMHFDLSIGATLLRYVRWAFEANNLQPLTGLPEWLSLASGVLIPGTLLVFVAYQTWTRRPVTVLFALWFAILLGPVLPLRDHITDYYLTIPLAAASMLFAYAVVAVRKGVVLPLVVLYLLIQVPAAYKATAWWQQRGEVAERLVRSVWAVRAANPGKLILLEGVSDEQFWAAVAHYPFVERGETYVYLTNETRAQIQPHPESGVRLEEFFLGPEASAGDVVRFRASR